MSVAHGFGYVCATERLVDQAEEPRPPVERAFGCCDQPVGGCCVGGWYSAGDCGALGFRRTASTMAATATTMTTMAISAQSVMSSPLLDVLEPLPPELPPPPPALPPPPPPLPRVVAVTVTVTGRDASVIPRESVTVTVTLDVPSDVGERVSGSEFAGEQPAGRPVHEYV